MEHASILVVDDDPLAAEYMALALRDRFPLVHTAAGAGEALESMTRQLPCLVITDLRMPEMDGLELLAVFREQWPEIPCIVVTVEDQVETAVEALQKGAADYLVKPVPPDVLRNMALRALHHGVAQELDAQRALVEVLGRSPAMARVRRKILEAARCELNVLITGETGTGKELAARAVHRVSARAGGPFVPHNCAATPADLFESLFFGHTRGAFTGALEAQRGLLEKSDGGILFLDEMECLTTTHQAKLLRVMDDGTFRPVGSQEPRSVAIRFLGATNREPGKMLQEGSLRPDLYYRLNEIEIAMPPLRARAEDIPLLASHFAEGAGVEIEPCALEELQLYSWPGNVRELKSVLAASLNRTRHGRLRARDLALPPQARAGWKDHTSPCGRRNIPQAGGSLMLKDAEREMILEALAASRHNLSRAARLLGIHRATLRRKIRELGLGARA